MLRFVLELLILKVKNGYALVTNLNMISARFMEKTFGGPVGTIAFNFNDMKTIFDLGWMETIRGVFGTASLHVFSIAPRFLAKRFWLRTLCSRKKGGVVRAPKEVFNKLQFFCEAAPQWSLWSSVKHPINQRCFFHFTQLGN